MEPNVKEPDISLLERVLGPAFNLGGHHHDVFYCVSVCVLYIRLYGSVMKFHIAETVRE